jgi:peptidoglycan/xylan/chitin deacetylase (PgdA/CDA1 family)
MLVDARPSRMSDVLVLCYHAVSERWPAHLSVTPDAMAGQLGYLAARGYRGATFSDAVTAPPAQRTVAVTFDDGYRSVLTLAKPILDGLGWPATVYVPTAHVGGQAMSWHGIDGWLGTEFEHELVGMTWDELGDLRRDGWEIGSHTVTHPRLTTLDDAALARELGDSRAEVAERLAGDCPSIAYPYGDTDDRVVAAAAAAGYRTAAALPDRLHARAPLRWPRVGVYGYEDAARFRRHVARSTRWLSASPIWPVAAGTWRAARRVVVPLRRA